VRVHIDPIPNTDEANLIVGVQERIPLRLVLTADRGGSEAIGMGRYTAGVTYANMWGMDHEATYQFVTTDKPSVYQAHVLSYRVPFSWRHILQVSGSYSLATPTLGGGYFDQEGRSVTGDIRYAVPIRTGQNPVEAFAGVNFKRSNNDLEFGGENVESRSSDIFQLSAGVSTIRRDKQGVWAFGFSLIASPGGVTPDNKGRVFNETARVGAKAQYLYGTFTAQRAQTLPRGWEFTSRAIFQLASTNLLPSEQLGAGGASSVRGYEDNSYLGDQGMVFSNELATPAWRKVLPFLSKARPPLETRGVVFLDTAKVELKDRYSADPNSAFYDRKHDPMASVGVGVRAALPLNFSLTADYGWQLKNVPEVHDRGHKGHIKVILAF
jgi:hemolysin activation/secretion protein